MMITSKEYAALHNISQGTVTNACTSGRLKSAVKNGRYYMIDSEDIIVDTRYKSNLSKVYKETEERAKCERCDIYQNYRKLEADAQFILQYKNNNIRLLKQDVLLMIDVLTEYYAAVRAEIQTKDLDYDERMRYETQLGSVFELRQRLIENSENETLINMKYNDGEYKPFITKERL